MPTARARRSLLVRAVVAFGVASLMSMLTLAVGASSSSAEPIGVSLSSSQNPSVFGQSVTFTANVSCFETSGQIGSSAGASSPTGSVVFSDGATQLGTALLNNGQATLTVSTLSVENHSISASYPGNVDCSPLSGTLLDGQTVNQGSTTTALTSSLNPAAYGQSTTLTATVSPVSPAAGAPTGSVQFLVNGNPMGTSPLNGSGVATLSVHVYFFGTFSYAATYEGDESFTTSTSAPVNQQFLPDAPTAVTAAAGVSQATVSWTGRSYPVETSTVLGSALPAGAPAYTVTYEVIAHDQTANTASAPINEGAATTATITGLTVGHAYRFGVIAIVQSNALGAGTVSSAIQEVPVVSTATSPESVLSDVVVPTSAAPSSSSTGATSAIVGTPGAPGSVSATASGGTGSVTVGKYGSDPTGGFSGSGTFFDVKLSPDSTFTSLTVTVCGVGTNDPVKWWNPIALAYQPVSNVSPDATPGCYDITINASTTPSISQLYGTIIAVGTTPQLAATGFPASWYFAVALSLLLLGGSVLMLSRRRQSLGLRLRQLR
jgi:LPXTG-motif cell wall-anchored protein